MPFDLRAHNAAAWDKLVERRIQWTIPVTPEQITAARRGEWEIYLTPTRPVPRSWFPPLAGAEVLCLASGGGQQAPLLAAAGARVTVLDNSPRQLAQDRLVAQRDRLELTTVHGDMRDLSMFEDAQFDLVVHPVSNCFVPDTKPGAGARRIACCTPTAACCQDSGTGSCTSSTRRSTRAARST